MTRPQISLFTCSHNNPGHIAVAISSVLRQTCPDFEYFILEHSTDGLTRGIIRHFTDPRITVIEEKTDDANYLLNQYILHARGQYIAILSDNDILMTNCFQEHLKAFAMNKTARACYHAIEVIYTYGNKPGYQIPASNIFSDIGAMMFERSLLDEMPQPLFDTDEEFVNHLSQITQIYPLEPALHIKRITADHDKKPI